MRKEMIFNEIAIEVPGQFHVMDEEELRRFFCGNVERWAIREGVNKRMLSVTRSKGGFLSMLAGEKATANGAVRAMRSRLADFRRLDEQEMTICGEKAYAIRFSYMTTGDHTAVTAQVAVFKHNKRIYSVLFQSPTDGFTASMPVFKVITGSMEFS